MNVIEKFISERPQSPLFHYTTPAGVLGILQDNSIWASSAYHLNDAAEFRYALNFIAGRLELRLKHEHGPMSEAYGELLEMLRGMAEKIQVFIASFSEHGDLLSQWLAYSGRNGYAVSIRSKEIEVAVANGFILVRCVYDSDEQTKLADAFIDAYCTAPVEADERTSVLTKALVVASAIKHDGFVMEGEWRLVKPLPIGLQKATVYFRPGRNGIVPYMKAPLCPAGAEYLPGEIYIGPNADMPAAKTALMTYLNHRLEKGPVTGPVRVTSSKTPYRP
jgi:hypothetical protein